jgi:hypothetical protein
MSEPTVPVPAPLPSHIPSGQAPGTTLEHVEAQITETPTVVLPFVGTIVDLREPVEVAEALTHVREVKRQLDELRALLEGVLRLESQRQGTKTLHLGALDAEVSGGVKPEYDLELLTEGLRAAGLPEERLAEAVVETVSYRANWKVLRQLEGANPAYASAIGAARTYVPTPWRVDVKGAR